MTEHPKAPAPPVMPKNPTPETETNSAKEAETCAEYLFGHSLAAMEVATIWLGGEAGWYAALHGTPALTPAELAERRRSWPNVPAPKCDTFKSGSNNRRSPVSFCEPVTPTNCQSVTPKSCSIQAAFNGFNHWFVRSFPHCCNFLPIREPIKKETASAGTTSERQCHNPKATSIVPPSCTLFPVIGSPKPPNCRYDWKVGARVADLCCGHGWCGIGLATAFPSITVDDFALGAARDKATQHGVDDRVHFHHQGLSEGLGSNQHYGIAFMVECLHDLPHPVEVLKGLRAALEPDGLVVIFDMAGALSHQDSETIGKVIRPDTVPGLARAAGFAEVETLDINNTGLWRPFLVRNKD